MSDKHMLPSGLRQLPPDDTTNNLTYISHSGSDYVEFKRQRNTGDSEDFAFTVGESVAMIWAVGAAGSQHSNRGIYSSVVIVQASSSGESGGSSSNGDGEQASSPGESGGSPSNGEGEQASSPGESGGSPSNGESQIK
jgi:hypothetical protein